MILRFLKIDIILIIILNVNHIIANNVNLNKYCVDLTPQQGLDLKQLMGIWYAIEVIYHTNSGFDPKDTNTAVCPTIYISGIGAVDISDEDKVYHSNNNFGYNDSGEDTFDKNNNDFSNSYNKNYKYETNDGFPPRSYRNSFATRGWKNLSLLWDEESRFSVEYLLRYEKTKPGFWISSGGKNTTEEETSRLSTFAGNLQVLKAVSSHVVITFCHVTPKHDFFTVILARDKELDYHSISSVHNLLLRKHLSTIHVRKVCRNEASSYNIILNLKIFTLCLLFAKLF